mgnify:CR=1 FL=1
MNESIISELRDIKSILSKLLDVSDLKSEDQFSTETLDKAAKLFVKFQTERDEGVSEDDLEKYFNETW